MEIASHYHFPIQKLVVGLILVTIGSIAMVDAIDLLVRFWPLILVLLGLSSELEAFRQQRSDGGSILIGLGVWLLAAKFGFYGLTYATAFPLAITVVGLFVTTHAFVDRPAPREKEEDHGRNE